MQTDTPLPLRLLVDADTQDGLLVRLLRETGHDVLTANEAGLSDASDPDVLAYAIRESRTILTYNARDFRRLHQNDPEHFGILAICRDRDPRKDMSRAEIQRAVNNVAASRTPLRREFLVLNAWNYPA